MDKARTTLANYLVRLTKSPIQKDYAVQVVDLMTKLKSRSLKWSCIKFQLLTLPETADVHEFTTASRRNYRSFQNLGRRSLTTTIVVAEIPFAAEVEVVEDITSTNPNNRLKTAAFNHSSSKIDPKSQDQSLSICSLSKDLKTEKIKISPRQVTVEGRIHLSWSSKY